MPSCRQLEKQPKGAIISDYHSDQVIRLLRVLRKSQQSASDIMAELGLAHKPTFRKNYLHRPLQRD